MALPGLLSKAVEGWSIFYADHRLVSVTVHWLHLGALLVGGGAAVTADRQFLSARREARAGQLAALGGAHRVVVLSLAVVLLTGLLMSAADLRTFVGSRLYWTKLGLLGLLLLNGTALLAFERRAKLGSDAALTGLMAVAAASLLLWLLMLFFGVWLMAAA